MIAYNSQYLNTLCAYNKDPRSPKNGLENTGTAVRFASLFSGLSKPQEVFTKVNIS